MRNQRHTNDVIAFIAFLAILLLLGFMVSCAVSVATREAAGNCSTWVVVPLLTVGLVVVGR